MLKKDLILSFTLSNNNMSKELGHINSDVREAFKSRIEKNNRWIEEIQKLKWDTAGPDDIVKIFQSIL